MTERGIALVAHDNKKPDLLAWAAFNAGALGPHRLYATGTTGTLLQYELGLPVTAPQNCGAVRSASEEEVDR